MLVVLKSTHLFIDTQCQSADRLLMILNNQKFYSFHSRCAFFLLAFRLICCSSSIVEYLGCEKTCLISDVYSKAMAIPIKFLSEIKPFCSKRVILLTATPDLSATCSRVIFFSILRFLKSFAISLAISSGLSWR